MKYEQIDKKLFVENRKLFSVKLKENTLAIFNANDIMPTNADGTMPFRQNNDLFWLCGVDQEESVLVIFPNHSDNNMREILFLKETNKKIAIAHIKGIGSNPINGIAKFIEKNKGRD